MKLKVSILTLLLALVAVFVVSCDNASNPPSKPEPSAEPTTPPVPTTPPTPVSVAVEMADGSDVPEGLKFQIFTLSFHDATANEAGTIAVTDGKIVLDMTEVTEWGTLIADEGLVIDPDNTKAATMFSDKGSDGKYAFYLSKDKIGKADSIGFQIVQNDVTIIMNEESPIILKKGFNATTTDLKPITMPTTIYLAPTTTPRTKNG
ncbi:MAG: hypothetical protein ACRC5H_02355 [Treponemataceae bacterium]